MSTTDSEWHVTSLYSWSNFLLRDRDNIPKEKLVRYNKHSCGCKMNSVTEIAITSRFTETKYL